MKFESFEVITQLLSYVIALSASVIAGLIIYLYIQERPKFCVNYKKHLDGKIMTVKVHRCQEPLESLKIKLSFKKSVDSAEVTTQFEDAPTKCELDEAKKVFSYIANKKFNLGDTLEIKFESKDNIEIEREEITALHIKREVPKLSEGNDFVLLTLIILPIVFFAAIILFLLLIQKNQVLNDLCDLNIISVDTQERQQLETELNILRIIGKEAPCAPQNIYLRFMNDNMNSCQVYNITQKINSIIEKLKPKLRVKGKVGVYVYSLKKITAKSYMARLERALDFAKKFSKQELN